MRRLLFFIVITAMGMFKGHSQALVQTYVDRCTGQVHVFTVPMNGATSVAFYNKSRTFTAAQFQNGELQAWLEQTYQWWQALSPCSTNNATSQTTQQTTTQATTNATNAASNATSNATSSAGNAATGTTNTTTTNASSSGTGTTGTTSTGSTNTTGNETSNTGSTNTGSTSSGNGSSGTDSGSSTGSSDTGSTGGDSGGTSSGGDSGSTSDSSSGSGDSSSGDSGSDTGSDSSGSDNSSGDGDSGDGDSSGGSSEDQGGENKEDSSSESSEESKSEESKEESKEEEVKEEESKEESKEDESKEEESDESKEEDSEEESDEEESSDEESEEDEEEDSEEEGNNEDEEEDDEDDEKERNLAPPIVTANLVTMQMIDGVLTNAASFGYSQSSLTGEDTYSANAMIWSNLRQYSVNLSKSHVFFNYDKETPVFIIDPDTKKAYQFGSYMDRGTVMKVQSLSVGFMRMFTTNIFTAGISDVYLGQKDNWMNGFVGGWAVTGMGVFLEGGQYVATAAFTVFGTKPLNFKYWDRLTISPMLAYSMTPASYDNISNQINFTKYGNYVIGSNFDFNLTQRFKANIGGTLIGSTMPEMPFSWALTVGSRFQF